MTLHSVQHYLPRTAALLALLLGGPFASSALQAQPSIRSEYELIGYDAPATHNRVARLAERLNAGKVKLEYQGNRGYLDSFLKALDIDPASQVLVFSKTSLQYPLISAKTPRAIYFNDDTYIGWVQHSRIVEITVTDAKLGTVFYTFNNAKEEPRVDVESQRCLVCHDSTGATGGGIPQVMARSSIYSVNDINLQDMTGNGNVVDQTPLADRWGGWYVSGMHGGQNHLGNIQVNGPEDIPRIDALRRGNLPTLAGQGLFDTDPYPTPTSDIVALMVLEHQLAVQNQLTYIKFKAPAVLQRIKMSDADKATSWAELPEKGQKALARMLDNLVKVMLFSDAVTLTAPIEGLPAFQESFLARGPLASEGHSLREFDLKTRLFRYRLSYQIYSEDFDSLPHYAKDYVYRQLAAVLEGRRDEPAFAHLPESERETIIAILRDTKPEIVPYLTSVVSLQSSGASADSAWSPSTTN